MIDWDDLRVVHAVIGAGTTSGAARGLRLSQSTVVRRIAGLEERLGLALFDKRPSGYVPTDDLVALRPQLDAMAQAAADLAEVAGARARTAAGTVRFSAPEIVLSHVLPMVLRDFRQRYPTIRLELVTTDRAVDLANGEADVALRGGRMPTGAGLFGRRLAYDRHALVASRGYAEAHGLPASTDEFHRHAFLYSSSFPAAHPIAAWFARHVPPETLVLRPDTVIAMLTAVQSGIGIAPMPRFVAERDPSLVILPVEMDLPTNQLWLLAHERSRGVAPVRQLMDYVAAHILGTNSPEANRGDG